MLSQTAVQAPAPSLMDKRRARIYDWGFWLLLLLFELFLLTLPLLPNGDGPMHTYLSAVFWKIAMHHSPLYAHYYAVRHLVQPYSLHYYLLILLEKWFSMDTAEKVVGGLVWATVAVGFRTLARALGPSAPAASLLAFALLFSWPFAAGFFNYTFGCGLLLFSLAFYTRLRSEKHAPGLFAGFLFSLLLQVLAHPVPMMAFILITGLDLCFQLTAGRQHRRRLRLPALQTAAFAVACVAFVVPLLLADKSTVTHSIHDTYFHLRLVKFMVEGICVGYFHVQNPLGWLYLVLIAAILPASVLLALGSGLLRRLRQGAMGSADRLLLAALIFLAASLCFPSNVNGSGVFAVRMWYMVWLLAAASVAAFPAQAVTQRCMAAFGAGVGLLCLGFGLVYLRPLAGKQLALEHAPLPTHERGLLFQAPSGFLGAPTHSLWALSFWDGVRAFTTHDDVLLNTPWLQLTIIPLRENGRAGLMRDVMSNSLSENTGFLPDLTPAEKSAALGLADFVLLTDSNSAQPRPLAMAASLLGPEANRWRCVQRDFYAICKRK